MMPDPIFVKGAPKRQWSPAYDQFIYHRSPYLNSQHNAPDRSFWIVDEKRLALLGNVHFHFDRDRAISHCYAPFGSFNGLVSNREVLLAFLHYIEADLRDQGLSKIIFHHHPPFYGEEDIWLHILTEEHYMQQSQVNHHIPISGLSFSNGLHPMERRKLKKSAGLTLKWHALTEFPAIFKFINDCRQQKGQRLSMKMADLRRVVENLESSFFLPAVHHQQHIIAATVLIKVCSKVWYNFYPAHLKKFDKISPMVFLLNGIYQAARSQGVLSIDLGTSQIKGIEIPGLMQFKSRVGGIKTVKPSLVKSL